MEEFGDRRKAFLGALLTGIGLVTGLASSASQAERQREAIQRQNVEQRQQAAYKTAESINNSFANTQYIDDFRDRFTFALGGNVRPNKYNKSKSAVMFKDRSPKLQVGGFVR